MTDECERAMKTPRMSTAKHACKMPNPGRRHQHSLYVCDCGCGWRAVFGFEHSGRHATWDPTWEWEQIL